MPEYPKTVREFRAAFPDETACRAYLEQVLWPTGPRCPRCDQAKVWRLLPPSYRCAGCGYDFTVTVGTLLADTRLPLSLWFEAMWYVVNQKSGASALGVQRVLGVSYLTAWRWLHKLRRAMVRTGRDRLAGVVEVDEVYIGGERPGKRGRGAEGTALVLVVAQAEEDHIGRIRLVRIANATAAVLTAFIVDIERFETSGKRVAYFGVLPIEMSSGIDRDGKQRSSRRYVMSKRGNDLVRRYLWMAALSAVQFNPVERALYQRRPPGSNPPQPWWQ